MKKLLCLLLILSFLFTLVSCDFSQSKINGVSLSKYSIVYSDEDYDYSRRAAEYIQSEIKTRTGVDLPLVEDSEDPKTQYEIVVGNTERAISERLDANTEGLEFAILAEDKQIALEGDYFVIAAAAYYFVETYVPSADYSATIPEGVTIHEPIVKPAKNYIMLIGDGMGEFQTKMFEYLDNDIEYGDGEDIFYGYYLPYIGWSQTRSLSGVTDSAAGGTALSSGYKTMNNYVGRDKDLNDVKLITELATELGMSAGVMSTEVKTGATPASFSAHADTRHSSAGIILTQATARDVYGIQIDCNFDYYTPGGIGMLEDSVNEMLDNLSANKNGFFLMYEEAHTDKHSHNNDMDKAFKAMVRFNQAIGVFMEFVFYNPDTFILITADHETGNLFPNDKGELEYHSTEHSGRNVPIFAYGDGSELFNDVTIQNIQIPQTIASFMGVYDFGDQSEYHYLGK